MFKVAHVFDCFSLINVVIFLVDCLVLGCLDWSKLFKLFRLAMVLLVFFFFLMFWLSIAIFSSFSFSLVFKNVFGWVWIVFILFINCFVWIV